MFNKKALLCLLAWSGIVGYAAAQDPKCRQCMNNNAYCIDDKTYYFCPDGENPLTSGGPKTCSGDTHCTSDPKICAASSVTGPCASSGGCGTCGTDASFICVSKTEFGFCMDGEPITSSCAEGQLCSMQLYENTQSPKKICAPESVLEFLNYRPTCDDDASPTDSPQTTVDPTWLSQQCATEESSANAAGARYFYIHDPRDVNCHTYIYCEKANNVFQGVLFTCADNGYWNIETRKCQSSKPGNCQVTTTSTASTGSTSSTESSSTTDSNQSSSTTTQSNNNGGNN